MKSKLFTGAASIALLFGVITAKAQKAYTEGVITYSITGGRGDGEAKTYFKADSNATVSQSGPATIKIITAGAGDYLAVLVDVPVANMKKAAVATPAEIEEGRGTYPEFTFTPTTETKQIAGFNCKKITVKDSKSGASFDAWITNDISVPSNGVSMLYAKAGGFPVKFDTYQQGQKVSVTVKSVSDAKVPAGTFKITSDYDKMSLTDLQAMGKNN